MMITKSYLNIPPIILVIAKVGHLLPRTPIFQPRSHTLRSMAIAIFLLRQDGHRVEMSHSMWKMVARLPSDLDISPSIACLVVPAVSCLHKAVVILRLLKAGAVVELAAILKLSEN